MVLRSRFYVKTICFGVLNHNLVFKIIFSVSTLIRFNKTLPRLIDIKATIGINDLIKMIEDETNKGDNKKMKSRKRSRQKLHDQFTFQPTINKKSQRMIPKEGEESGQRILKGRF